MSSFSQGWWKLSMPPRTEATWLPSRSPLPSTLKPGPKNTRSSSMRSPAGQSLLNFSVPCLMCARASEAAAMVGERPVVEVAADGDASVRDRPGEQRLVPASAAVAGGILCRIQKRLAVSTEAGSSEAARSSVGALAVALEAERHAYLRAEVKARAGEAAGA
jgi:hypothetical protein